MSAAERPLQASWWSAPLVIAFGALAILLPALYNAYPLVYSDTGTYLRSAFTDFVPVDRPYWYGVFIRITSLGGHTLWGVVVVQALLCSALLWRLWRLSGDGRWWSYLVTVMLLAPFTGLGWYAGQLVPDIFSAIGVLAGALVLLHPAPLVLRIWWITLTVIACWVHLSNLLIVPLVLGLTWLWSVASGKTPSRARVLAAFIPLLLAWPGLALANRIVTGEAHISRYGHVFLMSRMAETGILHDWLDAHCPTSPTPLCAYRDSIPTTNKQFMWSERSPLHWQGGPWAVREEYDRIIKASLTEPRFLVRHVAASLRSTGTLLGLWRVADELEGQYYRMDYSAPYGSIASLKPLELPAYLNSAQNTGDGRLGLRSVDLIYAWILSLASVLTLFLLPSHSVREQHGAVLIIGLATMVIGAWVCASLSTVDSRFMARTAWLLPWCVAQVLWCARINALTIRRDCGGGT